MEDSMSHVPQLTLIAQELSRMISRSYDVDGLAP